MTPSLPSLSTDGVISEPNVHRIQQYPQISGQNCEVLTFRGKNVVFILKLIKVVLTTRSSSYQDIVIHVQYYSKPNRARKLVCVIKQKFALRVFFLTRFKV